MKLETERLILREFTLADLDDFTMLMKDREVMRFSLAGPMKDKEQAKEYLQKRILDHYVQYGYGLYAAIQKKDNRFIGFIGLLNQIIEGEKKIELGFRLLPKYWGKGFATEAAKAICHYAFDHLGMNELISIIDPQNKRSLEVAKRIGMHFWKDAIFHGFPVGIYVLKKLILESFSQDWQYVFKKEREKLLNAFKDLDIQFCHIGSTAIPQCDAKAIIDILGITSDITQIDSYTNNLSVLGYQAMGEYGMKQRRYFRRKHQDPINLHIFEDSDPEVERHLRFVAFLKTHPDYIKEYSQLEQKLVKQFPGNIDQYSLGKEKFIKKIDIIAAHAASKPFFSNKKNSKKNNWTQLEILKAMEVNMHLQMTYFAKYVDTLELVFQPDATVVCSNIVDDTFNYILSARFNHSNVNERVPQILQLFNERNVPYSWWIGPFDTPETLTSVLLSNTLSYEEENIGMYLHLDDFIPSVSTNKLDFKKVNALSHLKDFSEVIVKIGGNPEVFDKLYSKIPPILYQNAACFEMYLAYQNNIPIVIGMVVLHANVAGIYYIATVPEHRKKGYGTAMMEHLIQIAKNQGYHLATLQASREGKTLYERLGFKECCVFKEYVKGGRS